MVQVILVNRLSFESKSDDLHWQFRFWFKFGPIWRSPCSNWSRKRQHEHISFDWCQWCVSQGSEEDITVDLGFLFFKKIIVVLYILYPLWVAYICRHGQKWKLWPSSRRELVTKLTVLSSSFLQVTTTKISWRQHLFRIPRLDDWNHS